MPNTALDRRLVEVVPSARQLALQQTEFYAFVHFSPNAYTGREWGDGSESPEIFDPAKLDAEQWVSAIMSAGMGGLILTCKHHDGFCLWPSAYTEHSVKSSPFRGGRGDIVREVSDACRRHGIKFGVYLSPWDRNNKLYGSGTPYNDYFVAQLTELLSNYGEIFSVWFDGACGEGPNGKKQVYDWNRYYDTIRRLQPNACIHVCGPDIRWCGNEAGYTRPSEWSVVPARTADTEKIQHSSQQVDDTEFRTRQIHAQDADLGSRAILADEPDLIWYPAEVNTSIRPGWFYHPEEDDRVRTLDDLMHVYDGSVGGNATFLLNIPPNTDGLFHPNDVARLKEIGDTLKRRFGTNLLDRAVLRSNAALDGFGADNVRTDGYERFFRTPDGVTAAEIELDFGGPLEIGDVVLKENITMSQRIEGFAIDAELDGARTEVYRGTVVGYKRIVPLCVRAEKLFLRILDSRVAPTLSFVGVYAKV